MVFAGAQQQDPCAKSSCTVAGHTSTRRRVVLVLVLVLVLVVGSAPTKQPLLAVYGQHRSACSMQESHLIWSCLECRIGTVPSAVQGACRLIRYRTPTLVPPTVRNYQTRLVPQ